MLIIFIVILIALSAFFSGSETGLTGSSRAKIHKLKSEGNKNAKTVSELRDDKDRLIGTILLGNNAVNIAATVIASNLAIQLYGSDYNEFLLTIIMTFIILIFAEVIPKTYAFSNAEKVALRVAPIFAVLVFLLTPITKIVQLISDIFSKIFSSKELYEDEDEIDGTDALRGAIDMHHDEGSVVKDDRDMLGGILDLADLEVGEIMIHRKKMTALNINSTNAQIIEFMFEISYSRIPFWQDNPENIIGVLHSKNLMRALQSAKGDIDSIDIKSILKKPWFVPENRSLRDQLKAFRKEYNHFAFVVDEYGALLGMVTLEDILEEIVGQIEEDSQQKKIESLSIEPQDDGSYMIDAQISIRDLNRELGWDLPDDEASTLAGLIIYDAQIIPETNQIFHFHGYRFKIIEKHKNQIIKISAVLVE